MVVPADTWGALFHARPQPEGLNADLSTIAELGFTILEQIAFAGRVEVIAYGRTAAVIEVLNDFTIGPRLPHWFIRLTQGQVLTPSLIKRWATIDEVVT